MQQDLLFRVENGVFNVRAAGVLVKDGMVLLQKDRGGTEYALPGGQVQFCENAETALEREFLEETGASVRAEKLLWTEECFWTSSGLTRHTITFYFRITDTSNALTAASGVFTPQKDNQNVVWGFVPLQNLSSLTVYPSFLDENLKNPSDEIRRYVTRC